MRQLAVRIDSWRNRRHPVLVATLVGVAALAALVPAHAALGFADGFRVLYVLPIWAAIRLGGRFGGLVLVLVTSLLLSALDWGTGARAGAPGLAIDFAVRAVSFVALGLVVERVEAALAETQRIAARDPLTGVLNRRALSDLAGRMGGATSREKPLVAVMIDCDGFKALNDAYGHSAGDHVLQILARVLQYETRADDLVARVGGDEFVLVLNDMSPDDVLLVLQRVQERFEQLVMDAGYECTISAGIAASEEPNATIDEMLRNADRAMYEAKAGKRSSIYLN